MTGAALLVETTRRDVSTGWHVVESRHGGHVTVLDPAGDEHTLGDPEHATFVRSAAKPFQAATCLEILDRARGDLAAGLSDDEIAVAWASHRAEAPHLTAVRSLLRRFGTPEEALTCPEAAGPDAAASPPRRIRHNCSGKHAMFALAGRALEVPEGELLDPDGALQRRVLADLTAAVGPTQAVAIDGCGAPAVAAPLRGLARGFHGLLSDERYRRVRDAGLRRPHLVGGTRRLESALLERGVVAKPGAEGVFAAAWLDASGDPWAVALKVEDGASRAAPVALHGLLVAAGVVSAELWSPDPVLGGGRPQGVVRAAPSLMALGSRLGSG